MSNPIIISQLYSFVNQTAHTKATILLGLRRRNPPENLSEDGKSINVAGMKWFPKSLKHVFSQQKHQIEG